MPTFRFRLVHVFYAMAIIGASLATCGVGGLFVAAWILAVWFSTFWGGRPAPAASEGDQPAARPFTLMELLVVIAIIALLVALLLPAVSTARHAARRVQCTSNLKQIAIGLYNYREVYGSFPPAYVADANGKPLYSWRVLLLPFLEQQSLYDRYRLDEPWDGPNNRKLLAHTPRVFQCADHQRRLADATTSYFAVVGPNAAWSGAKPRPLGELSRDASDLILVLEGPPHTVAWSEPRDLSLEEAQRLLTDPPGDRDGQHVNDGGFLYATYMGRNAALADGATWHLPPQLSPELALRLLQVDDGPGALHFATDGVRSYPQRLQWANLFRLAVLTLLAILPLPWAFLSRREQT